MRHGESQANRDEIIVSSPAIACHDYGLTGQGVSDVANVALQTYLNYSVKIYCSDFLRTKQTSDIVADVLDAKEPIQTPCLRERFFGDFDGTSTSNYQKVWQDDEQSVFEYESDHSQFSQNQFSQNNVESVYSVLHRMIQFLWDIENQHSGESILFVSHGDCLQILLAWFQGLLPNHHRTIMPIHTSYLRSLISQRSEKDIQMLLNICLNQAA